MLFTSFDAIFDSTQWMMRYLKESMHILFFNCIFKILGFIFAYAEKISKKRHYMYPAYLSGLKKGAYNWDYYVKLHVKHHIN